MTRKARYCTSDFKRAPIDRIITRHTPRRPRGSARWRVLNVLGIRADESKQRENYVPFEEGVRAGTPGRSSGITNGVRQLDQWYPIFRLSVADVWAVIHKHGIPTHPAYALGMPRLSCRFCVFAPRAALIRAGYLNRDLLEEYVAVEREIGHRFTQRLAIADVLAAVEAGEQPPTIPNWEM
jgi:3'-phosphoadenosine 5'-phosphosulfate sulfotransferase (PAPS reductase)/FAD synthetase